MNGEVLSVAVWVLVVGLAMGIILDVTTVSNLRRMVKELLNWQGRTGFYSL